MTLEPVSPSSAVPVDEGVASALRHPFEGLHQAGILEPAQRVGLVVAFVVTAADRKAVERMFRTLTATIRYLVTGGEAPAGRGSRDGIVSTPYENGILGPAPVPDRLTVTVSVGSSLFDDRFGLEGAKPARLRPMDEFDDDDLDRGQCDGDLLLQICTDNNDTALNALRLLTRATRAELQVLWRKEGFTSPPRPGGTPRNLFGFRDGTANHEFVDSAELTDRVVWTAPGGEEPAWVAGGTYHVVRLIRMFVEFWDRISLNEQQRLVGRDRDTGAPLESRDAPVAGLEEYQIPDHGRDPNGNTTPLDSHIRLANPRDWKTEDRRMLRRGFNYSSGTDVNGHLDMGQIFICFNRDLDRQFVAVQKALAGEPLTDYVSPFGGGYFFALPGVQDADDWLGRGMLA